MEMIFSSAEYITLTENHVKQLHGVLLQYSSKDERHRGQYKTLPNNVEAFGPDGKSIGIVFETTSPFDTPYQMTELVEWTRANLAGSSETFHHPLLVIGAFIVRFLAIHPFQDGNGRLSRALTTLLLLRAGYAYVPYSSLESIVEENKEAYYLALRRTQTSLQAGSAPDFTPWLSFFFRVLRTQKARLAVKIEREQLLSGALPEISLRILEIARERGRVKSGELVTLTGEAKSTIRNRLNELVARGYLVRHGSGPATWYVQE